MKKMLLLLFVCCSLQNSDAQYLGGLTHQPDTSYNNRAAYKSNLKTNPETRLVPESKDPSVAVQKNIVYTSARNRSLLLDAFYPKEKSKRNGIAIIMIHGGGWRTGNRTQHYALVEKLATLGYTCFTPEYRLSTEALFPAAVYDLKAAICWVRSHAGSYGIDSAKITAAGFSAGGELAAFLGVTGNMPLFEGTNGAMTTASNLNAVIDLDGILSFVHPESGEGDDSKRISAATYWFGYPRKGHETLWAVASSLSYADQYTPPTLFINSSVARMHAGREDYIAILNSHHIYSEVHHFDNTPHSFPMFEPWFTPTVSYIDGFLQKVLINK